MHYFQGSREHSPPPPPLEASFCFFNTSVCILFLFSTIFSEEGLEAIGLFYFYCCFFCFVFVRTSVGRIVKLLFVLWLERVRRTTAGIHNVIFTLLLGSSARNYDVTHVIQNNNKIFSTQTSENASFLLVLYSETIVRQ